MAAGTVSSITPTERKELRNIIHAEFELLANELQARATELQDIAEERVREQFAADVERAKQASEQLREMAQEFEARATRLEREFSDRGLEPKRTYQTRNQPPSSFRVELTDEWVPKQLDKAIREVRAEVSKDLNKARTQLTRQKLDIQKQLSLTAIQTSDAQSFLSSIPKADELLPEREVAQLAPVAETKKATRPRKATPKKD